MNEGNYTFAIGNRVWVNADRSRYWGPEWDKGTIVGTEGEMYLVDMDEADVGTIKVPDYVLVPVKRGK